MTASARRAALQVRAGIDVLDHLTFSAAFLAIPDHDARDPTCGLCFGKGSTFKAVSTLAIVRAHTDGDVQAFADVGAGIGHMISLSDDDYFENPPLHGRAGPALFLGAGGRWFVDSGVSIGVEAAWTMWTHVVRPIYSGGARLEPARDDLTMSAVPLLLSVGWSSAH